MSERRHTPVADDEAEETEFSDEPEDEAEAYFMRKAAEFDRKKSMSR